MMRILPLSFMPSALAATALLAPASASARVASLSDVGFTVQQSFELEVADPAAIYALVATPARWWSGTHSYSGDAANLSIDARAGGCFCEALPARDGKAAGSVEHGRVIHAAPGRQLRIAGALGPLQAEAVSGTLDFAIEPVGTGKGVRVTMTYVVGGYARMPMATLAPMVDQVLNEQLQGLQRVAERR